MAVRKISRRAIQDGRDTRHKTVFGPRKAQLILRVKDFPQFRLLPDFNPKGRGANSNPDAFWFSEMGHWCMIQNEDDPTKSHHERWTCWDYLKEEQPRLMKELLQKKEWTDDTCRCLFCEVIERFSGDYDSLPQDTRGFGPEFRKDKSHNMTVLVSKKAYEEQEDDPYPVKIYPAKATAFEGIMELSEEYGTMIDENVGREIKVTLRGTAYSVLPVAKASKVWIKDWQKKAQNLEDNSVNLHSYAGQVEYFEMRDWQYLLNVDNRSAKRTATRKKVADQKKGRKKATSKVTSKNTAVKKVAKKKTARRKK